MVMEVENPESMGDAHQTPGQDSNVQVVIRIRPPNQKERDQGFRQCAFADPSGKSLSLQVPQKVPQTFTFDHVAGDQVSQEGIFSIVGRPITEAWLNGFHCCLIAYGQTGSGKTYTMEGPDYREDEESSLGPHEGPSAQPELRGLIPRVLHYVFERMSAESKEKQNLEFSVHCSYLQIYNEEVSDLLNPDSNCLNVREDARRGTFIEGLQEVAVSSAEATYSILRRGTLNRTKGMTAANMESSRSHSVFTLSVESQRRNSGGIVNRKQSRFYLVDLAGSERQKFSEAVGTRLREAGAINRSLSALGNVIKALVDIAQGKIRHVPYRDSKLTFLLKDALGGNAKCTLIANISPAEKSAEETLSTLKFAQRAKLMRNTAVINEDLFGNSLAMGEEIRRLHLEIGRLRAKFAGGNDSDTYLEPQSTDEQVNGRILRLEDIIRQTTQRSLAAERKAVEEIRLLQRRADDATQLIDCLEKKLMNEKLLLKLRDSAIKRLEAGGPLYDENEGLSNLLEELEILRRQVEYHPDALRFRMDLDAAMGRLNELEAESNDNGNLHEEIGLLHDLNGHLREELQDGHKEQVAMSKEIVDLTDVTGQQQARIVALESQVEKVMEAGSQYRNEALAARQSQLATEEKLEASAREHEQVRTALGHAEAQAAELAQKLAKKEELITQHSQLNEDLFAELQKANFKATQDSNQATQCVQEAVSKASKAEDDLCKAVVERDELAERLQGASTKLDETSKRLLDAEEQQLAAEQALKAQDELKQQVAAADASCQSLTAEMGTLQERLSASLAREAELDQQVKKGGADILSLEELGDKYREDIRVGHEIQQELEAKLRESAEILATLRAQACVLTEQVAERDARLASISQELRKLEGQFEQASEDRDKAKAMLQAAAAKVSASEEVIQQATAESKALSERVQELEEREVAASNLASEHAALMLQVATEAGLRKDLESALAGATSDLAQAKQQREDLVLQLEEKDREVATMEESKLQAAGEADELNQRCQSLSNRVAQLEVLLQQTESERDALSRRLDAVLEEEQVLNSGLAATRQEVATKSAACEEALALLAEAKESMARAELQEAELRNQAVQGSTQLASLHELNKQSRHEAETLRSQLEEKLMELRRAGAELSEARAEIAATSAKTQSLDQERLQQSAALERATAVLERATLDVSQARTECAELREAKEALEMSLAETAAALRQLDAVAAQNKDDLISARLQVSEMLAHEKELQQKLQAAEDALHTAEGALEEAVRARQQLSGEVIDLRRDAGMKDKEIDALKEVVEALEGQAAECTRKLHNLQCVAANEREACLAAQRKAEELAPQLTAANDDLSSVLQKLAQSQALNSELQVLLSEKASLASMLEGQLNSLAAEKNALEQAQEAALGRCSVLERELRTADEKREVAERDLCLAMCQQEELQAKESKLLAEMEEAKQVAADLRSVEDELRVRMERAEQLASAKTEAIMAATDAAEAMQAQVAALTAQNEELRSQLAAAGDRQATIKEELSAVKAQSQQAAEGLAAVEVERVRLQSDCEGARSESKALRVKLSDICRARDELEQRLSAAQGTAAAVEEQLRSELKEAALKCAGLERSTSVIKAELERSRERARELDGACAEARAKGSRKAEELRLLKQTLQGLQALADSEEAKHVSACQHLKDAQLRCDTLESALQDEQRTRRGCEGRLGAAQRDLEDAGGELAALRSKLLQAEAALESARKREAELEQDAEEHAELERSTSAAIQDVMGKKARLEKDAASLRGEKRALESENALLKAQLKGLEEAHAARDRVVRQLQAAREESEGLKLEKDQLAAQLQSEIIVQRQQQGSAQKSSQRPAVSPAPRSVSKGRRGPSSGGATDRRSPSSKDLGAAMSSAVLAARKREHASSDGKGPESGTPQKHGTVGNGRPARVRSPLVSPQRQPLQSLHTNVMECNGSQGGEAQEKRAYNLRRKTGAYNNAAAAPAPKTSSSSAGDEGSSKDTQHGQPQTKASNQSRLATHPSETRARESRSPSIAESRPKRARVAPSVVSDCRRA